MSIEVDLHFIVEGPDNQTNFRTQLLHLIFKADKGNLEKLRLGFPREVMAVEHYRLTGEIIEPAEVTDGS